MATFSLQEQRVIIRFLHLRGATPIEIHCQLSETCGDGVMNVKNVRSWALQFKEGRTSCDNEQKQSRPRTSRSDKMLERVEKVVLEDRRLSLENIASKVGISVGSVHKILHEDLRMRKVSSSGTETLEMLKTAYKDDAMRKTEVFEWFSRFKNGEMSIDDKPRSGRPSTTRTHKNVEKIREIIKKDR
ncbi:hypothetical protein B7P43_G08374 [Cryptotermes secundus]|uniref:Mos1 transposase HTH domain-containing protein n=1 Tax=Cryptotermes secundus TaxID=105785 RepID=A0A2J7RAI9_9NEOP|nr:hypothetical protein B7P43_G08374 [Cryptotermes secundus]